MHVNDSDTCPNNNVAFLSTLQNHLRVLQQPQLNFLHLQGICVKLAFVKLTMLHKIT